MWPKTDTEAHARQLSIAQSRITNNISKELELIEEELH